jgi:hypothetical protein
LLQRKDRQFRILFALQREFDTSRFANVGNRSGNDEFHVTAESARRVVAASAMLVETSIQVFS